MRPVIGVTGPDEGGFAMWIFTWFAVWHAGGKAIRLTPSRQQPAGVLHGLIIGGGADVEPGLYGQVREVQSYPPITKPRTIRQIILDVIIFPITWIIRKISARTNSSGLDTARDALELRLIREALEQGLPILGICRGEQLLNVFFGGTLHQGLTAFYTETHELRTILPRKEIVVPPGSILHSLFGDEPCRVNALHRQGVGELGEGVRVSAYDRNGIIQAIEHESFPFVMGVQWHPEFLPQASRQRKLFQALVERAGRKIIRKTNEYCSTHQLC